METKLYNQEGKEIGNVELNNDVFSLESNDGLVHRALIYQLSNARLNYAHTKTRGERRGSTRKIFKQKGTGRARAGGNRSPLRKKGGVSFGPRNNQNFTIQMNKKERRLALFTVLSNKARNNNILVVDSITLNQARTADFVKVLSSLKIGTKTLFALATKNDVLEKSSRNIPTVKSILVDYLNVADLLKYETLLLLKDSLSRIDETFVK